MNTAKETKSVRQLAPLRNATQKTTVFAIGNQDVASLIMTVKVIHTHTTANVFICQDMEVEHVQAPGTRGARGGRAPPKIEIL